MPRTDRRLALFRNISTFSALLSLSQALPSVTADGHQFQNGIAHAPVQGTSPSAAGSFRDATLPTELIVMERQVSGNVLTLPIPLPTPIPLATNPNQDGTLVPLLISPYIPPSSPPVSLSRTSSVPLVASKTSASAQPSSSGNSSTAANTANNSNSSNSLTPINFLPFIILTSFFIISLMGWCLHGWCTRKPKEKFAVGTRKKKRGWFWRRPDRYRPDNDELVSGPPYAGQDVEEFATVRESGRYRWPSLSAANRHRVSHNEHTDEDPFLSKSTPPEFAGLPLQTVRSVPSANPPREPIARKAFMSPTTTAGPLSPTSIALRELYEVVLRGDYDGPSDRRSEERTPLLGVGSGVVSTNRSTSGRKRRPHVRRGSESQEEATQLLDIGGRWKGGILSDEDSDRTARKKLEVRNPSVGEGRLGLREEGIGLVGVDEEDEDKYTPLPTPTRVVHQFFMDDRPPESRITRDKAPQSIRLPLAKDVLPAHPKQITSPPLESQIYFVPMPPTAESAVGVSKRHHGLVGLTSPPARVRGSVRPKSRVANPGAHSTEKFGEHNNPAGVTTSPLRIATGKVKNGKLVKASPAAREGGRLHKGGG